MIGSIVDTPSDIRTIFAELAERKSRGDGSRMLAALGEMTVQLAKIANVLEDRAEADANAILEVEDLNRVAQALERLENRLDVRQP